MALEKVKVTGVKFFNDEVNGKHIDSGKIFIEEILDFTKGTAKGSATQVYTLKSSKEVIDLMKYDYPLLCEVEFVRVTTGKDSKIMINRITPVPASPAPAR